MQKHRLGSELKTDDFNPKIKKDQPRNPAPRSSAHVKAGSILPWLTKVRFGTSILERVWPPLETLIGAGPKCTISVCLALQMLIFPEIVGICARITRRTHLQKHLRIGYAPHNTLIHSRKQILPVYGRKWKWSRYLLHTDPNL